jgi:hypothetical protein
MRALFAAAAALWLVAAVLLHLGANEHAAEFFGDLAFFTLLAAVVVPAPVAQKLRE